MPEVKEPTTTGVVSSGENSAKVTFGETEYTIQRLRAGKFFEAIKVYMSIIKEIAPKTPAAGAGEATVDLDNLVVSMFENWPEKMIQFTAICCSSVEGLNEEKIRTESYPEQIIEAFRICSKLNRVGENLKNFVTPIGELGDQLKPAQG